ncbi:hypothetical protein LEP1GSC024_2494 [Leptospira noguchii str. 2001034031]|uniref:Uncharacterized protein n=1 Tax=Leptospira noguchii str. 2001034031 TaxID=1193053 RepID=M6YF54_9LEPT|nr:hypothetical protein LEP1GSC024_2494 [Leptospira noguchii str. 2001034031]
MQGLLFERVFNQYRIRNHSTERNRIHQVGFLECYKTNTANNCKCRKIGVNCTYGFHEKIKTVYLSIHFKKLGESKNE